MLKSILLFITQQGPCGQDAQYSMLKKNFSKRYFSRKYSSNMYKVLVFLEILVQMKLCKVNSILSFSFICFRCNKGYTLEGERESSCLASGSWSHSPPVCELVKCSSPEDINHGTYILSGLTYLSTASYSCENGYRYSPRQQPSFLQYPVIHYLLSGFHFHVIGWL